jgi:type IV secretion system protein TrbL
MINKYNKLHNTIKLVICVLALLTFNVTYSQQTNTSENLFNTLDSIDTIFYGTASSWLFQAESYAKKLLLSFVVLDILILGIKHILKVESINDVFNALIFRVLFSGGILSVLQFLPMLTDPNTGFIKGFEILGSRVTGVNKLSPTGVIDIGLEIVGLFLQHMKDAPLTAFFQSGLYLISIVLIMYCFITIAVELIVTKIEAYILIYGGCVFLCLGGSKYTEKYAKGYFSYVMTVGIKLFIAYLVVGVGVGIADSILFRIKSDSLAKGDYQALIITCVIFVIYATIAKKIGQIANGFLSGMTSTSGADVFAAAGAATSGAAAVVSGGKMAAPGSAGGIIGGLGSGLGKAAGDAMFKGAGHAHAAGKSFSNNFSSNIAKGGTVETAAPKAAAQTLSNAAKNIGSSIKNNVSSGASDISKKHNNNVKNSPFNDMPPPPKK